MKKLYRYFFRGLITALPLGLTIYFFYVFLIWAEQFSMWLIRPFIQEFYLPGMGIALGLISIILLGYLVSHRKIHKLLSFIEVPFTNIPVVKSIYSSLKSFADYFAPHKENTAQQAVILMLPGQALEIVGLITRQDTKGLPGGFMEGDRVAVYLPMGYNIGGYTVFVPRDWVKPIDMSTEDVMRASLFAWITHNPTK
ncbi:MAG: hypothetical protein B7X95_09995 [Methylophilaceae bacterium 17-44-8]|jgi:uncharacterized membrane protein|nr:MAG: hypothetical protein B7Y48_04910 [Methylophilales bacterium 28-44-11]OZA04515.1 MAG: hypothetical protein B7X95_09995 [Methylophilaceae bacterium 17-44-8]